MGAGMRARQLLFYMLRKLQTSSNNHPYPATFRLLVDVDDDGDDVDSDRIRICEFGFKLQTVGRFYVDAECRSTRTNFSTSSGEGMFPISPWMNPHSVTLKDDQEWVCAATMEEENTKIDFNRLKIELISIPHSLFTGNKRLPPTPQDIPGITVLLYFFFFFRFIIPL